MKSYVDRELCISAGTCIAAAPKAFKLDQEGKAVFIRNDGTESSELTALSEIEATAEELIEAAKVCPTAAIFVYDQNGKQIWPES